MSFDRRDDDARALDPRWKAVTIWSVPLEMQGVLQLGFSKKYPWLLRERELLQIAAERSLAAAEKARLIEQLAASERPGSGHGREDARDRGTGTAADQPRIARRSRAVR
jgi:GAF domain-containing protein